MRSGQVAIVGRTNVGKSTLLNHLLGQDLAIVSPLPQTTRDPLLGVVHGEGLQIACIDTPGLHRPKHELGRRLNYQALEALRATDVVVFVTDVASSARSQRGRPPKQPSKPQPNIPEDDLRLLQAVPEDTPCLLIINKIDRIKRRSTLLPFITAYTEARKFAAVIPLSARTGDGVENVIKELRQLMPEGPALHDAEALTDRPVTYFAREYIREQVLLTCRREVPHAVAVTIDKFEESSKLARIDATMHVEKTGQRGVLVGQGGRQIKAIGTAARLRLEDLMQIKVHLQLFVRVTPHWKNMPRQLAELGYEGTGGRDLSSALAPLEGQPKTGPSRKPSNPT